MFIQLSSLDYVHYKALLCKFSCCPWKPSKFLLQRMLTCSVLVVHCERFS
nr:hypothetical protein Iba_chr01aCG13020 [Ipomoea batatas]